MRIESLKDLNKICQKPRYKEVGNWMVRHILRDAALPVTWLLLHTKVSANQVTAASLVSALIGIFLMTLPSAASFLAGAFLLQLWYLLDHVDGQIARYRQTASLSGRFFDFLIHHIVHSVLAFGLGIYNFHRTSQLFFLLWGCLASFSIGLFNFIHDVKCKTFIEKLDAMEGPFLLSKMRASRLQSEEDAAPFAQQLFSWLHKSSEIHVIMNLLTLAALLEQFVLKNIDFRFYLFLGYGTVIPFLAIVKTVYLIAFKKIDEEFAERFKEAKPHGTGSETSQLFVGRTPELKHEKKAL